MLNDFHFLIMRCFNHSNRAVVTRTGKIALLPGQSKILECLLEHNSLSPKEIGQFCAVDKSTMTSLLNKMEEQGLIARKADPKDRRGVQIWLTKIGAGRAEEASSLCAEVDRLALKNISASQQKQLCELLQIVTENLERENRSYK